MITSEAKQKAVKANAQHKTDTGSPQVQVGILTQHIESLTSHLKVHAKDNHSRRGLLQMIGQRKSHLAYLRKKDFGAYQKLVSALKIRG